ncbi:MAG: hypothetical protein HYY44_01075 [Deltaproteobacteria bacterium]|nr:hypothetical protein [Deltaproteobacteria bacterium]MBI4373870.1 hypothetical protein [Deltaproteobacteria bacterium]
MEPVGQARRVDVSQASFDRELLYGFGQSLYRDATDTFSGTEVALEQVLKLGVRCRPRPIDRLSFEAATHIVIRSQHHNDDSSNDDGEIGADLEVGGRVLIASGEDAALALFLGGFGEAGANLGNSGLDPAFMQRYGAVARVEVPFKKANGEEAFAVGLGIDGGGYTVGVDPITRVGSYYAVTFQLALPF